MSRLFTLSGGHLFSIYDGCRAEGIEIVDVRHEQTAAFAAEGWAKVTREVGVCALTAGPGVTNGLSAMASAQANHSPIVVLGGRAPAGRWGQGSLQEIDHVPFVRPLSKLAATARSAAEIPELVEDAFAAALAPHGGPAFVDLPMDYVFMEAEERTAAREGGEDSKGAPGEAIEAAGLLLGGAERPVIMAGTDLYWGHGEVALRELVEALCIPVFLNGLARGCVAADHELYFSRTRSRALREADVALVIGVPMDFRLGFGGVFGEETEIVAIDVAEPSRRHPRAPAVELYGSLSETLSDLRSAASERAAGGGGGRPGRAWVTQLRAAETELREGERAELQDASGAAASAARVRRVGGGAGARRNRDRRRRRLRLLRRPRGGQLRAGLLAGSGAVRVPGCRAGVCAGGEAGAAGAPGGAAAGRRRVRVCGDGAGTRWRATAWAWWE